MLKTIGMLMIMLPSMACASEIEVRGIALVPCKDAVKMSWWGSDNAGGQVITSWILGYFTGLENIKADLLPGEENKTAVALVYQQCKVFIKHREDKSVYDAALTIGSKLLEKKQINNDPNTNLELN